MPLRVGKVKQNETKEDLDGQCQGKPEGEKHRLDQDWRGDQKQRGLEKLSKSLIGSLPSEERKEKEYFCHAAHNRNRKLQTSKAPFKSQAQGTSLFTSAASNQRGFPKNSPWEAQVRFPEGERMRQIRGVEKISYLNLIVLKMFTCQIHDLVPNVDGVCRCMKCKCFLSGTLLPL